MDKSLLEVLVCPVCRSNLYYDKDNKALICKSDKLSYPIREGIPVMIVEEATKLTLEEIKKYV